MRRNSKTVTADMEITTRKQSSPSPGFSVAPGMVASNPGEKSVSILLAGLLTGVVILVMILAAVPPVSRDALTHHLAVPKLYLQHGSIHEIPEIGFSYYPMNLDLLYMIPLYFGNDILPKYLHYLFALFTAALIFVYLRKRLNTAYGLFGALFFLSIPVIVKLSVTVYVDLGLTFFSFGALLALLRWRETGFQARYLMLAAIACGLALGTKYNGLVTLFLLTLMAAALYVRSVPHKEKGHQWRGAAAAAGFALVALLVFSPWMVRNLIWTGNPIYPFYNGVFRALQQVGDDADASADSPAEVSSNQTSPWNHILTRRMIYGESWWQIVLLPLRIFYQGADDNPKYFDGKLNPFLLLLTVAAFWLRPDGESGEIRLEKRFLLLFAALFVALAFLRFSIRIRYIAPVIPPLILLSTFGLHHSFNRLRMRWSTPAAMAGILVVMTVALAFNAAYIAKQFAVIRPLDYIGSKVDRHEYIARYRPEYTAIRYANDRLDSQAAILGMFLGNRRYYFDRRVLIHNSILRSLVSQSSHAEDVAKLLAERGITHLLVRHDLFNQWAAASFDPQQKKILARFVERHLHPLKSGGGYGLYALQVPIRESESSETVPSDLDG